MRGLLDGMILLLEIFGYGAKCERYTGHRNTEPIKHALTVRSPLPWDATHESLAMLCEGSRKEWHGD
jgi:hypothetical protein